MKPKKRLDQLLHFKKLNMKTFENSINPEITIISFQKKRNFRKSSNSEINDKFVRLFCKQIYFGDRFKEKFNTLLVETDFAYPNDAIRIKEAIDLFIESSNKMVGDYIEGAIEAIEKENESLKKTQQSLFVEDAVEICLNESWTKDWMEQTEHLRFDFNKAEILDNKMDDFYYYADVAL
jgi:hypothetical protein